MSFSSSHGPGMSSYQSHQNQGQPRAQPQQHQQGLSANPSDTRIPLPPPPTSDDTRHHIVQSLFSKTDEQGTVEETLISYVKVYEDEGASNGQPGGGEPKTRYLMLAGESFSSCVILRAPCFWNDSMLLSRASHRLLFVLDIVKLAWQRARSRYGTVLQ
jgi:hypothetical protein